MEISTAEISVKGKLVKVPSVRINGREIVVTGKGLRLAAVRDSEWLEGDVVVDPDAFITALKQSPLKADIFSFAQRIGETEPKYPYPLEWDNVAAVPITNYLDWWENRLTQVSRKNVRRAQKRGVVVKAVLFDDALVTGIMRLYNETPIRQGRQFWHYGKDFATVKRDNSSYLDRSEFIAAYFQDELIGFIKMVFVGKIARIMQILSMNQHFDKRPPNALIAKAVEVCCAKGASHFVYGKYIYDNKANSPITEFKRRNGFEQIMVPTYNVALTLKGQAALALNLHRGVKRLLPERLMNLMLNARNRHYAKLEGGIDSPVNGDSAERDEKAGA